MEYIFKYWQNAGILAIVLGLICFAIGFYFFRILFRLKRCSDAPKNFETELKKTITDNSFALFKQKFDSSHSLITKVICKGIEANNFKLKISDYDRLVDAYIKKITVNIVILAALTEAAPLVGLFGTVLGMIETFNGLAGYTSDTGAVLASGISKALITTQAGLIISIPGIFGILFLAVKETKLKAQMESYRTIINLYRKEKQSE